MNCWFCLLLAGTTALPTLVRAPTLMMQPSLDIKPFMSFPVDSSSAVGFFPNFNTVSKGASAFSFSVMLSKPVLTSSIEVDIQNSVLCQLLFPCVTISRSLQPFCCMWAPDLVCGAVFTLKKPHG